MGFIRRFFSNQARKVTTYFRILSNDYFDVAKDIINNFKVKPVKSLTYSSLLLSGIHLHRTNPKEVHFESALTEASLDLGLVHASQLNRKIKQEIERLYHLKEISHLRHLDLALFSVVWRSDFAKTDNTYEASCKHLRPHWTTWLDRIEDVGIWRRWHRLETLMENYDVNEDVIANLKEDEEGLNQLIGRLWRRAFRRQYSHID